MNEFKNAERAKQHKIETEKANAQAAAAQLEGKTVKLTAKAGQGASSSARLRPGDCRNDPEGFRPDIDKRKLELAGDIKSFGTYECEVKLYAGISAKLFVMVGENRIRFFKRVWRKQAWRIFK